MRRGRQEPTFERVGDYDHSDGAEAVSLFSKYGVAFIPAQAYEMELYLAKNEIGEAEAINIGLSRPRQNGKSFAARYYALWAAFIEGRDVLYSAHRAGTVRKMFKFMCDFITANRDFTTKLKTSGGIYKAQGAEGIYLADGRCIEFSTRTNSSARGGTYDVIVVDEAQEMTAEQRDALMPTTIAGDSGDPQVIYIGTPPNHRCPGTVFRDMHDRAHAGELGGDWWLEWAAGEVGDPLDVDRWYECNPMMGYRIKERSMRSAAQSLVREPDSFAREYLGWWDARTAAVEHVIDADAWALCETDDPPDGPMCAGVKFGGDRTTLSACIRPEDGAPYVEWVDTRPVSDGVGWCAEWIDARRSRIASVAIDGGSAAALTTRLADVGFPRKAVEVARPSDMAKAVSMLVNAVNESNIAHYGQEELTDSAVKCARRRIGSDGVGFADASGADSTLIESCALALWRALTTKRRPGRKAVVY